MLTKPLLVVR